MLLCTAQRVSWGAWVRRRAHDGARRQIHAVTLTLEADGLGSPLLPRIRPVDLGPSRRTREARRARDDCCPPLSPSSSADHHRELARLGTQPGQLTAAQKDHRQAGQLPYRFRSGRCTGAGTDVDQRATAMDSLREGPRTMEAAILPARVVYLINEGSHTGFIRAVQEATGRWGGMTEPIVPVGADGTVDSKHIAMISFAELQAAVYVDVDLERAGKAADALKLPLLDLEQIDLLATCSRSAVWAPPSRPSYPGGLRMVAFPQLVHGTPDGPLWHIAVLGCPKDTSPQVSRKAFGGDDVWRTQLTRGALIALTVEQFGEYRSLTPGHTPTVVWMTDPDSLTDCLDFWNLRALRPVDTVDMPMVMFTEEVVHWDRSPEQLALFLKRPGDFTPDVALVTQSLTAEQVTALADAMRLEETTDEFTAGARHPQPALRQPPFTYRTDLDPTDWVLHERAYGIVTSFDVHVVPGHATTLRITSPVTFYEHGSVLLRIFGSPLDGLPARQAVANLMGAATWSGRSIEVCGNAGPGWHFKLNFPSMEQATTALLDAVTAEHTPSPPGKLAAALCGRADTGLLLDPGVYETATALTTPRSHALLRDLEEAVAVQDTQRAQLLEIASQYGGRAERRFLPASQIPVRRDTALKALETLCQMGWAERGLQAPCDRCGRTSFHPGMPKTGQPVCPACQAPVTYTQDAGNLSTVYRLDGFVDLAADHGALPHLLVIAALTRAKALSYFLPGTDVVFSESDTPEVDIYGIWDEQVLAGEVKTSASEFTTEQLQRDVALSKRLGADVHLLAAVDTVSAATIAQARTLCEAAGLELEVWDTAKLRSPVPKQDDADTATETFERLASALVALTGSLQKDPAHAARRSGAFLKAAMEPRSPSAGQVEALKTLIIQYGDKLVVPLAAAQQALAGLLGRSDEDGQA